VGKQAFDVSEPVSPSPSIGFSSSFLILSMIGFSLLLDTPSNAGSDKNSELGVTGVLGDWTTGLTAMAGIEYSFGILALRKCCGWVGTIRGCEAE